MEKTWQFVVFLRRVYGLSERVACNYESCYLGICILGVSEWDRDPEYIPGNGGAHD